MGLLDEMKGHSRDAVEEVANEARKLAEKVDGKKEPEPEPVAEAAPAPNPDSEKK
jgi:hypothetical protein